MQNSRGKKLWILPNNNGDMPNDQLKHKPKKHWFKTFKKKKLTLDFDGLKKKKVLVCVVFTRTMRNPKVTCSFQIVSTLHNSASQILPQAQVSCL